MMPAHRITSRKYVWITLKKARRMIIDQRPHQNWTHHAFTPMENHAYNADMQINTPQSSSQLIDRFDRHVNYLRLSVTDRCDFRCTYCMAEDMTFLPRKEVLSLEELFAVGKSFVSLGVSKIRITGGEPLIRNNILELFTSLGKLSGLDDLSLTTNGSRLEELAENLKVAGVDRINISLDSLQEDRFKALTRHGNLSKVLAGIDAAIAAGFKRLKLNSVLLKNYNLDEATSLCEYALGKGLDISFIEEMPLGEIHSHARDAEFISSEDIRKELSQVFTLSPSLDVTGGPSRYWNVRGHQAKIGFISPHSHNFCETCNRVRVTASGRLLLCLGNEHSIDLRQILRHENSDNIQAALRQAILNSMHIKPKKHEFNLADEPQILRFMNATGG